MNGSPTLVSAAQPSKIWRSETNVTIPAADILTFAFANLGQYDEDKPVSALCDGQLCSLSLVLSILRVPLLTTLCPRSLLMLTIPL